MKIAGQLKISPRTTEYHKAKIMELLDLHNTAELVKYVLAYEFVTASYPFIAPLAELTGWERINT